MRNLDVDRIIAGWRGPVLAALVAILAALAAAATMPPFDRDESRYAEATAQMVESGDYVNIEFQDQPRHKKPVGIHWMQSAAVKAFSGGNVRQIPPYRVPSMLGAALAAAACAWGAAAFFGQRAGVLAGVALGSTVLLSTEGAFATTDAVLCGVTTLSLAALGRLYGAARGIGQAGFRSKLLFWLGMAVAILVKGPIGPMVAALTLIALGVWDRDWTWMKRLGWGWGALIVLVIFGPWAVAITIATHGAFWGHAIGGDLAPKLAGGQESHGAPPGLYLGLILLTFFPATLLIAAGAVAGWTRRAEPAVRFALCWLIPSWIVFEAAPTKLPGYVLPLYGALCWLIAAALTRPIGAVSRWIGIGLAALGAVLVSAVAVIGLTKLGGPGPDVVWAWLSVGFALAAAVAGGWLLLLKRAPAAALAAACGFGVLAHAALLGGLAPSLRPLWSSRNVVEDLRRAGLDPKTSGPVAYIGYAEPSAVFLDGARTNIDASPAGGADAIAAGHPAVVDSRQDAAFKLALAAKGVQATPVAVEKGYNYSKGRPITLTIYRPAVE